MEKHYSATQELVLATLNSIYEFQAISLCILIIINLASLIGFIWSYVTIGNRIHDLQAKALRHEMRIEELPLLLKDQCNMESYSKGGL